MALANGIANLLSWAGAPVPLVRWCEARAEADVDLADLGTERLTALVSDVPDAHWAPWVAAAATIPMDLVAAGVAVAVEAETARVEGAEAVRETVELAIRALAADATGAECLEAAERCERTAEAPPPAGYRASSRTLPSLARAAANLARAVEAIVVARSRAELERMNRARAVGATLGLGVSAVVPAAEPPVLLARRALGSAPDEELVFATDSLGAALGLVAAASSPAAAVAAFVQALRAE